MIFAVLSGADYPVGRSRKWLLTAVRLRCGHSIPVGAALGREPNVARALRRRYGKLMKSTTAKLPKGQSYPLKPSVLEAALTTAQINLDTYLSRSPSKMFDAHFWPPSPEVSYERLYIRIGSVPAEQVQAKRNLIEREALPALVQWVGNILAQDPRSPIRREKQHLGLRGF